VQVVPRGLDLAIELIEREHAHKLFAQVGEWFIRTELRPGGKSQRISLRGGTASARPRSQCLAKMEDTLEGPAGMQELSKLAGVSLRQLERLFSKYLQETVTKRYLRIRLEKAADMLRKTGLSVTAIGVACGFQSSSHFSRAFKARYGKTPGSERR
jgi:transcriptional regulator GlxA family with amidase domain